MTARSKIEKEAQDIASCEKKYWVDGKAGANKGVPATEKRGLRPDCIVQMSISDSLMSKGLRYLAARCGNTGSVGMEVGKY